MTTQPINELSHDLIGAAIEVHRELGPGLLESVYESAFVRELSLREISHARQVSMPVAYKVERMELGFRMDVVADSRVVVELKAVEKLLPIHATQLLTYLRLGGYPLGLLINFNVRKLTEGIERVSNSAPNLSASSAPSALKEKPSP